MATEVKNLDITGISTVPTSKRLYPQGELASQVIGAVGTDNQGLTGLEHSENSVLGGANGEEDIVHDAVGRPLRMETVKPASVGEDVQTTLDAAIQAKTEEALNEAVDHYDAKGGTAIVMNPNTGDIMAMANYARFRSRGSLQRDLERAREPRDRLHLRARLDLQGLHGRLGSRGPRGHPELQLLPAARDPASTTGRSARPRTAGLRP